MQLLDLTTIIFATLASMAETCVHTSMTMSLLNVLIIWVGIDKVKIHSAKFEAV